MASGYFTGTTGNKYITARITWSSVPDTVNNRSTVTATLAYMKSSASTGSTYGVGDYSITINGSTRSFSVQTSLAPNDTWVTVGSHSAVVNHNSDGTKSVAISATGGISGLTFSNTKCSGTAILDKIPRATVPTFAASEQTIGSNMTIRLNAADTSFRHKVTYSWGPNTGTISTNAQASVTWTIPMDFCTGVPNGTQGTLFVTVETFTSGGVSLGKSTQSTKCNVPASVVPTISAVALTDSGGNVPSDWGVFVQHKSRLHVKVTASGAYYSSIVKYSISALGVTIAGNDRDVGVILSSGNIPVEVTVTDSRGRTATTTQTIAVQGYSDPYVEVFSVERANSTATPVDNGDYAKIAFKASGASVGGKNTVTARIYHKRSDLSTWTLARTIDVAYSVDQTVMIASMVPARSYAMKVELADAFSTTIAEETLKAEGAVMGWYPGGIGISFGKAAEEEYTADFDWDIHGRKNAQFDGNVNVSGNVMARGLPTLQIVDSVTLSLGGTNVQLGANDAYVKVPFSNFGYNLTGVLTITSGGILIPAGVRAVRVSAQICLSGVTGLRYAQITKNDWSNTVARCQRIYTAASTAETMAIPGTIMTVAEGDVIMLGVYGKSADTVYGNHNQTYLAVEAYA